MSSLVFRSHPHSSAVVAAVVVVVVDGGADGVVWAGLVSGEMNEW